MSFLLIIGAKSDIARATAREFAGMGFDLILAGRHIDQLETFKKDIEIRYRKKVVLKELDITDYEKHEDFYRSLEEKPEGILIAVGYLPDQHKAEKNGDEVLRTIAVNYTGPVHFLNIIANDFGQRRSGFIIGISSVAGDRGRKKNYIYGSAKAGFTAYLSGLRQRLAEKNVQVITVKPGFVRTRMTQGMDLPEKLTAEPEEVAKDIVRAYRKKKDILYTKWFWRYIMLLIRLIPESLFKKLNM